MSIAAPPRFTVEEFLALPDDGVERWLIDGELRENGMTQRNRFHSGLMIRLGRFLDEWVEQQPEPRGEVVGGEAGVRFSTDSETSIGVDIAYVSGEVEASQTDEATIIVGVPTLIAEILSPNDRQSDVAEKVQTYLDAGVKHVWVVDPDLKSVRVYRPNADNEMVNATDVLTAEPDLPGLQIDLKRVFRR